MNRHLMIPARACVSALALTFAMAAHAQTAAQTAAPAPASEQEASSPDQLGEIIVTAQRRAENIQSVPVAVTAVSGAALLQQQIQQPSQLVFVAPSLQQQGTTNEVGATDFSIRGVGTAVFGPGIESSVATVLDDVTLSRPQLGVIQFFDLDNIQVLRGPQGMLFGKNASAGVVSVNTARPSLSKFEGIANVSLGTHDLVGGGLLFNGNATINAPLSNTAAVRVSLFGVSNAPYVKNINTHTGYLGAQQVGGRLKFLWKPTGNLELYLSGDYVDGNGIGDSATTPRENVAGGVIGTLSRSFGIIASPDNLEIASNGAFSQKFKSGGAQANLRYTWDSGVSLTNILAYRAYKDVALLDFDVLPISFADGFDRRRDLHQVSDEIRLASPTNGRFTWQLGLYALDLKYQTNFVQSFALAPLFPQVPGLITTGIVRDQYTSSQSYAAFGQGSFELFDGFSLMAGGRFTHDRTFGHNIFDATGYLIPLIPPGNTIAEVKQDNFSYRVGANYKIGSKLLAYVTYARGYKGPALDETTLAIARPEIPKSLEAGLKFSGFHRRLTVNLAAYRTVYRNFQAQAFVPTISGGNYLTVNAGSLRVQGFEAEFRAAPVRGLTLNGGLNYNDGVYREFTGAPCYAGQPTGTTGRFVCLPVGRTDISGGRLANAPRFTATLAGQYETSLSDSLTGFVGADFYHRSSVNFSPTPNPRTRVGSVDLVGARIGVHSSDDKWRVELYARNLFDKRFPTYVVQNPLGGIVGDDARGGDYVQNFGPESFRSLGVALSFRF